MKKHLVRAVFAASLLCAAAGTTVILSPTAAIAADKIGKAVGAPLSEAQKLATAGDFQGALAKVKEARAVADRTAFEDYKINQFLGFVSIKLNDFASATTAYEAMADSPAMPDEDKKDTLHNVVLLSAQAKQWQKTIAYGQQLAALNGLDDQTTADLALAYYNANDFAHAQQYAQQEIDAAKAAGQPPNQTALQIVMGAQAKSNNQAGAEQTLEQLAVTSGSPETWGQVIDVTLSTRGMKDLDALFLYRLRVLAGAMSHADDYTLMGSIAYQLGYPTEAVSVLQQGISSGKVTAGQAGDTLRKSRSDAATDAKQLGAIASAAERSKNGEQDAKLGEDYWGYGRYADAEAAARRAIGKGGLKVPGEGYLLLGMTLVAQNKYDDAIQAFGQVTGPEAETKTAHVWSLYAQSKKGAAGPAAPAH